MHTHKWRKTQFGFECYQDACWTFVSFDEVEKILDKAIDTPYTGRKCGYCRQPEHSEPTRICSHKTIPAGELIGL